MKWLLCWFIFFWWLFWNQKRKIKKAFSKLKSFGFVHFFFFKNRSYPPFSHHLEVCSLRRLEADPARSCITPVRYLMIGVRQKDGSICCDRYSQSMPSLQAAGIPIRWFAWHMMPALGSCKPVMAQLIFQLAFCTLLSWDFFFFLMWMLQYAVLLSWVGQQLPREGQDSGFTVQCYFPQLYEIAGGLC